MLYLRSCCWTKWPSCVYVCVCVWIYIYIYSFFFHVIFHHVVTQETGQSSLCCTVGPQYLSTPNFIVCILQPHTPHPSTPSSVPSSIHKSVLHVPDLFLFCRWDHFCPICGWSVAGRALTTCISDVQQSARWSSYPTVLGLQKSDPRNFYSLSN